METLQNSIIEYKQQLEKGAIQKAYKGILEYLMALRTYFEKHHPEYTVPGGFYSGYMDMSYFSILTPSMKDKKLKIAIVFIHDACRFEVWLAGVNKGVQADYWQKIRQSGWNQYKTVSSIQGADAIIEHVLVKEPDFDDPIALTRAIELETIKFIVDVEGFLSTAH